MLFGDGGMLRLAGNGVLLSIGARHRVAACGGIVGGPVRDGCHRFFSFFNLSA